MSDDPSELRCPVCGAGVVVDVTFEVPGGGGQTVRQDPSSNQVVTYSCGHERIGPRLESADQERLDVERRASEDTVDPAPEEGSGDPG